jgi:phage terminase large subunit-like protein
MVRANPKLRRRSKVIDSSKRIVVPTVESFYRALSAEVAGKHGFNSHGVIFDEIHAQKDRQLWEVLTFGAGAARTQPLIFGITTAGIPGESPVAEELHGLADQILRGVVPEDPSFLPIIYAAPDNADWRDEEVWRACNPALGDFLDIRAVREEYNRACRLASEQNSFRRLRLNQWVAQETRFIDMADWDRCNGEVDLEELRELPCYAGLDLSTKSDVTALVFVFLDGNGCYHLWPCFWLPEENLTGKPNQESAKYRVWKQQGFLNTTPGNVLDYSAVRERLNELQRQFGLNIREVAFDPWNATQFAQHLQEDGFTPVEVPQNFRHLSEATKELQNAAMQGNLRHGGHPVLRWMADCMTVKQDTNGNVRPVKPNRLKNSKRIDGIVASVMAMSRAMAGGGRERQSIYDQREIRTLRW